MTEKTTITQTQYDIEVEKAFMFLVRNNYMSQEKAMSEARKEVSEKYQV